MDRLVKMVRGEQGQDFVEYALIITFLAVLVVLGITFAGEGIGSWFSTIGTQAGIWAQSVTG